MKHKFITRITYVVALNLVLAVTTDSIRHAAAAEQTKAAASNNQGKEIIIARDTEEGGVVNVHWCGSAALAYQYGDLEQYTDPEPAAATPPSQGIYWVDFSDFKPQKLKLGKTAGLLACSQDGKWIIYSLIGKGGKLDKAYWRYNLHTKEKQRFAPRAYYGGLSPDGKKLLLLQTEPSNPIQMPDPQWQLTWLQMEYSPNGFQAVWFADTKRILVKYQTTPHEHSPFALALEIHDDGKQEFKPLKADFELGQIRIDSTDRIYGFIEKRLPSPARVLKTSRKLVRCEIIEDSLKCEEIFKGQENIFPYDISRSGKTLVFQEEGDPCIWHYKMDSKKKRCVAKTYTAAIFKISPDGQWLVYPKLGTTEEVLVNLSRQNFDDR